MRTKTSTQVKTQVATERSLAAAGLTAIEEQVVRMRHGLPLAEDAVLERRGQAWPSTRAALEAIEARALAGRQTAAPSEQRQILDEIIGGLRKG